VADRVSEFCPNPASGTTREQQGAAPLIEEHIDVHRDVVTDTVSAAAGRLMVVATTTARSRSRHVRLRTDVGPSVR